MKGEVMDIQHEFRQLMSYLCHQLTREVYGDRRRLEVLAWGVLGLLESQKVSLAEWGAVIQSRAQLASSHQRRLVRWLHNRHVDVPAYYAPLIQAALANWPRTQRLYLALDSSPLPQGLILVQVVLLYRGRAVPLSWRVLEHGSVAVAYSVYEPLLQQVCHLLAGYEQLELSADRGFFNGKLIEFCLTQGWHFRLRATRDTLVVDEMGRVSTLARLCPPAGAVTFYPHVSLMHQQIGPVHLALAHPTWTKRPDPWYVVSDEVTTLATFNEYAQRAQIESSFLDHKSGGFKVEDCEVQDVTAWNRLFLILAVAMLHLTALGVTVAARGWRRYVDTHWDRGLSYLKLGWRWVRQQAHKGWPRLFTFALDLLPDPQRAMASRCQANLPPPAWQLPLFPP